MAAAPRYKVFNPEGRYVAACKHVEDAACLVANYGDGATIRLSHAKRDAAWTEGAEDQPAGESYDHVRNTVWRREAELRAYYQANRRGEAPAAPLSAWAQKVVR